MYLYLLPLVAALLGWLSNYLLLRYILGKALPAKAPALAAQAGRYLSGKVLHMDTLAVTLADPAKLEEVKPLIEHHIDIFLKEKIKEKMPAVAMFIGEKTMDMMKRSLMDEIDVMLPELVGKYLGNLGDKLDIEKRVQERVQALPEGQIAALLRRHLGRERMLFSLYGALTGFVIGILMLAMVLMQG